MKKMLILAIIISWLTPNILAQYHFVNIILSTDSNTNYPLTKPIFVCGNDLLMGNWNPKSALMKRQSDTTRVASFMIKKKQSIEFCFTDGVHGIMSSDSTMPCPFKHTVEGDTIIIFRFSPLQFSEDDFLPPNKTE